MPKGHPKVGWACIGFAVAAPCTNLCEGIVLGIVLGWPPIGFAAMAAPRPSQYYFGHTVIPNFVRYSYEERKASVKQANPWVQKSCFLQKKTSSTRCQPVICPDFREIVWGGFILLMAHIKK